MTQEEEILDIVDANDVVIGTVEKTLAQKTMLRRRIVHIFVFDSKKRLLLQLRGPECKYLPGYWSTSVGGHVMSGEEYLHAALREFKEELGVIIDLVFLSKDKYNSDIHKGDEVFLCSYTTQYSGKFIPEEGKVSRVEYFSILQIKEMIKKGEKFHPELLFLLQKHFF